MIKHHKTQAEKITVKVNVIIIALQTHIERLYVNSRLFKRGKKVKLCQSALSHYTY